MFLEKRFTQTTREALSASMRETLIAPSLLRTCCACGLVKRRREQPLVSSAG
jgi:hypothetical protein